MGYLFGISTRAISKNIENNNHSRILFIVMTTSPGYLRYNNCDNAENAHSRSYVLNQCFTKLYYMIVTEHVTKVIVISRDMIFIELQTAKC